MTPLLALFLTYLFLGRMAQVTNLQLSRDAHEDSGFVSANVGDSVTMQCFYEGFAVRFYWYKQSLENKPRLVSAFYKYEKNGIFSHEFSSTSRFSVDTGKGKNHLIISDLHFSDSATYYCISCCEYDFDILEAVTIYVKGSDDNIPALVHQSASESIQTGGSMTLNCTVHTRSCDGEHTVHWFKHSEESHPGLIYTHGDRDDKCERKANTQTHTCVYNLPMESLNLSHTGTTYCAVASCGHILFGDKKKMHSEHEAGSSVLVHFLIGALALTTTLAILLAFMIINRNTCKCADSRSSAALTEDAADYQEPDNLHYAALREHRVSKSTRQRDNTTSECVYSSVRQ